MNNVIVGNFRAKNIEKVIRHYPDVILFTSTVVRLHLAQVIDSIRHFAAAYRLFYKEEDFRVLLDIEGKEYVLSKYLFDEFKRDLKDKSMLKVWELSEGGYTYFELRW